ncbi:protein-export chaperone SecB [Deinococcus roseus]|uniref:Uncharacterized protein n=1 Tax=Deinococcus roseus TaxID=392414 RepID=A0ABQ2D2L1_9DEIO|nr:protein-export chaperone SecB [Deinococcus roseus]GGJ43163.1 hypothetical protein GCM10008938_31760 [Deinococcus roseus]
MARKKVLPTTEEYSTFIQHLELVNVLLKDMSVSKTAKLIPEAILGFEIHTAKPKLDPFPGGFCACVTYTIKLSQQIEATAKPEYFAQMKITLEGIYNNDLEISAEIFEVFAGMNLPVNLWPYLREMVHSLSLRMGFPGLILPVHKV